MQMLTNDRILFAGRFLKVMVVAPELRMSNIAPPDLGVQFSLYRQDQSAQFQRTMESGFPLEQPAETGPRLRVAREEDQLREMRGFPPFTARGIPTRLMEPGAYGLLAYRASDIIDHRSIVVLDDNVKWEFLGEIRGEGFRRDKERYQAGMQVEQAWNAAWQDVFAYLGARPPAHVGWIVEPFQLNAEELNLLIPDVLRWVAFHVGRFLFDQVFFGGNVRVARNMDADGVQFRVTTTSVASQLPPELPEEIDALLSSLENDDVQLRHGWQAAGNEGELHLTWNG